MLDIIVGVMWIWKCFLIVYTNKHVSMHMIMYIYMTIDKMYLQIFFFSFCQQWFIFLRN